MTTTDNAASQRDHQPRAEYRGLRETLRDRVLPRLAALYTAVGTRRRGLLAASLVRIGYGVILVGLLLDNLPLVNQLWGPHGEFGYAAFRRSLALNHTFSLWAVSGSPTVSVLLYLATLLTAVLFLLGWRTRIVTPVLWLLVFSWGIRNPTVLDGGDNVLDIMLVYLCLVQSSAYLSLDARRRRRAGRPDPVAPQGKPGPARFVGTVAHNVGVTLFVFQVCVIYLVAGMTKVQGSNWQSGTAVYYILRISEFNTFPELTRLIYPHALLVVFITYLTVLLQIGFPFLLLHRVSRHVAFFVAAGMHLGIAVLMGLPFFSGVMLVSDVLIFADRELFAMRDLVAARLRGRRRSPVTEPVTASVAGCAGAAPDRTQGRPVGKAVRKGAVVRPRIPAGVVRPD